MNDYNFGNFICTLRENKGLTQRDIADMLGVTPAAVSKWENGSSKPRVEILFQLAKILGVRPEELVEGRFLPEETINAQSIKCINERYEYLRKIEPYTSTNIKLKRLVSSFIDLIISVVLTLSILLIAHNLAVVKGAGEGTEAAVFLLTFFFSYFFLVGFHDFVGFGRSIGKRIMGLVVLNKETGENATIKKRLLRNAITAAFVLIFPTLLPVDTVIMLVRGQSIGDSIANTVIVKKEKHKKHDEENHASNTSIAEISTEQNDITISNVNVQKINAYTPSPNLSVKFIIGLVSVIAVIIIIATALFVFLLLKEDETVSTDIEEYEEDCAYYVNASDFMPDLDSLTDYTEIFYSHKTKVYSCFMGFASDGLALFVQYDESVYEMKKAELLNSYTFLETPVIYDDRYELPVTEFFYKNYYIKVILDPDYSNSACKSFALIGFDDESKSVVYCYHYSFDLDYIAEQDEDLTAEMCEFMDDAFAWKE